MSYDIRLKCKCCGQTLTLEENHGLKGGTYCLSGSDECALNITYNYAPFYVEVFGDKGIRWLYGKTAGSTIAMLDVAIEDLGAERAEDYWDATRGNAGAALADLLVLAKAKPGGVWDGD